MKKIIQFISAITIVILYGFSNQIFSQNIDDGTPITDSTIFTVVEEEPSFPGGDEAILNFLRKNIVYLETNEGIQGTVYTTFIVEKDGSISNIKTLRGVSSIFDKEVIRVVKLMPKWVPGKHRGKNVRVLFNFPVKFSISPDK